MCYAEHMIRYYGCNTTMPVQTFASIQIISVLSTVRCKCHHMKTMERLYNDFAWDFMANNPQNMQNLPDIMGCIIGIHPLPKINLLGQLAHYATLHV